MSAFQQNQSNGFSPILLSPSSTTNPTLTGAHFPFYDNSDQGSVDSDYTSLSSSKFYGHGGSTSSLHRQGRSQSIDELASATGSTTTIPTRHFNGASNVNKTNADPLQFVKIHPNHDLIERAQEQLTLAESRKRLQETFKLIPPSSKANKSFSSIDDDDTDWSKAVENWRQKREQKRKQSVNINSKDDEPTVSPSIHLEPSPIEKTQTVEIKVPPIVPKIIPTLTTNNVDVETKKPNCFVSKSPSPQRIRGPSKIHEISIEKPLEIRGFGFKLEDGTNENRPVYISTIEDGSPADKAGLCIDDEVISMNGENIERMTFDQVRKILKERNLRGSIKLLVRTYEDVADDNSQTVTNVPTTDHSRTPSPHRVLSSSQSNPQLTSVSSSTSAIRLSNTTSNVISKDQSPVYTFSPSQPISSSGPLTSPIPAGVPSLTRLSTTNSNLYSSNNEISTNQSPSLTSTTPSLSIFAPKPFRSTASLNFDTTHNSEPSTRPVEQPVVNASTGIHRDSLNTPSLNNTNNSVPLNFQETVVPIKIETNRPPPLSSVESLLHGQGENDNHQSETTNESPITQVRSSVEKQMNQLQQELLLGFPNASNEQKREHRPVPIPIDLTNAAVPKSALKKTTSYQTETNVNRTRLYEKLSQPTNFHENSPITTSHNKRIIQDLSTGNSELRINLSPVYSAQSQEKVSVQSENKFPQQRITSKQLHTTLNQAPKKTSYEDRSWIGADSRPLSSHSTQIGNSRRTVGQTPISRQTNNQPTMFHYGEQNDQLQHSNRHSEHHRDIQTSNNRNQIQKQPKSPIRTTINSNNNRVLSVSGKLRCSRCSDELGQGSAMVIESLGLYYHIECFRCFVCNIPLSSSFEGTDVRVRENRLHCQNCFSDNQGAWRSNV